MQVKAVYWFIQCPGRLPATGLGCNFTAAMRRLLLVVAAYHTCTRVTCQQCIRYLIPSFLTFLTGGALTVMTFPSNTNFAHSLLT